MAKWRLLLYLPPEIEFWWQTEWQCQICHTSGAGKVGSFLVEADFGGKLGIAALFATRKWILGGKRSGSARFATQVKLEQLGTTNGTLRAARGF